LKSVPVFGKAVLAAACLAAIGIFSPSGFSEAGSVVRAAEASSEAERAGLRPERRSGCEEDLALIKEELDRLSQEMHHLRRDVARLREEVSQPGLEEAMAGVGFIFGLFGVAFFLRARGSGRTGPGT
jgi:hypothetical protein